MGSESKSCAITIPIKPPPFFLYYPRLCNILLEMIQNIMTLLLLYIIIIIILLLLLSYDIRSFPYSSFLPNLAGYLTVHWCGAGVSSPPIMLEKSKNVKILECFGDCFKLKLYIWHSFWYILRKVYQLEDNTFHCFLFSPSTNFSCQVINFSCSM